MRFELIGSGVEPGAGGKLWIRRLRVLLGTLPLAALLVTLAYAAKQYTPPHVYNAKTYPARDEHPMEKVTVAADPYDLPEKEDAAFHLKYKENGFLPILLVISNEGEAPISVMNMKVEYVTGTRRVKLLPATEDDLYRRFSHLELRGDEPSRNPLPVPLPRKGPKTGVPAEGREEFQGSMFKAKAVEPHENQAGFVFFDVQGISQPLAGSHLYVTGVKDNNGQELMYFEIAMEKYLTYQPVK
ncbi:MAG TPA: hypothetical protein VK473_12510 [Terriglobales bacterium]|nr:hypothetical protein [Terriglobales bacterium]